ncbi:GATA transcription factor 8-like protein [Cinnamomum micranthum f. kanehirae]|uniref:GATA transcription factor 8-like protein n=1 Tax=Cinnamomum micranthum f. kanehirae TaxID=337451 RepID=A0A443NZM1_9MAGN|nr:GATA transcription factor 8-like protein [Cinnamomum micranthum f. kanehirae]
MMGQAYYMENNMMGQGYMENNVMGQSYMENTEVDACGDFFDELLLDFPNEDIQGGDLGGFEGCFPSAGDVDALSGSSFSANSGDSTCSVEVDFAAGLSVPCEDMAQLEWLSNFFEEDNIKMDMNSDDSIQKDSSPFQTSSPVSVLESRPIQLSPERLVPGRARSKRSRPPTSFPRTELSSGSAESDPPKKKMKEKEKREEEPSRLGPNRFRGGSEMQALWDREDPTVEDGSHGAQDSLQRLWGPLQVRPAVPGVPSGGEPDVRGGGPFELSQEGDGDEIIFWQGGDLRFYYY